MLNNDIIYLIGEELKNIIERHEEQEKEKERIKEINFDLELRNICDK